MLSKYIQMTKKKKKKKKKKAEEKPSKYIQTEASLLNNRVDDWKKIIIKKKVYTDWSLSSEQSCWWLKKIKLKIKKER